MPRTPRSREEIERNFEEEFQKKTGLFGTVSPEMASSLTLLDIRRILLDIRDAVMEGRSLGDDFFTN